MLINMALIVLEVGNFFAGQSFDQCKTRPDLFWRGFVLFQTLVVCGISMFAIERDYLRDLLPSYEFNNRTKDLLLKSFIALEISGLGVFFICVIVAYSTCSVKGVWVGLYYWILSVLGFLFGGLLVLLWVVAGHHVFRSYYAYPPVYKALKPYILSIKAAETEQDQRSQYQQFRTAVDNTYGAEGFSEVDFQFLDKYSAHMIDTTTLEKECERNDAKCIQCDDKFKLGDRMLIFRDCLHSCHLTCLIYRLRCSDLCQCGYGLRQVLTEPCFPDGKKDELTELLKLHPAIPVFEAIIISRNMVEDLNDEYMPDNYEYVNFWDIKEAGVEEYLELPNRGSEPSSEEVEDIRT